MFKCPSFNPSTFVQAADMPDCDGAGALDSWVPPLQYFANYGISFPTGPTGSCVADDPYFNFPGSTIGSSMSIAAVTRPAETAITSDGFTGLIDIGRFTVGTTMGCEASNSHQGGGNFTFLDGHSKWIARNAERYEVTDPQGCIYKKYFTLDK